MAEKTAEKPKGYVEPSFERDTRYITDRITADGSSPWPVEPGRYRLVAARACPWANRAIIVRRLLGLEDAISMGLCGPTHDQDSWTFDLDPGDVDPVLGIPRLKDAYERRQPGYPRGITVPAMVDVPTGQVVTNDFAQITLDFSTQWTAYHRDGAPDLYPESLRDEKDGETARHDERDETTGGRRRLPEQAGPLGRARRRAAGRRIRRASGRPGRGTGGWAGGRPVGRSGGWYGRNRPRRLRA
jgi:glutathionyl-hydroquinone reductase